MGIYIGNLCSKSGKEDNINKCHKLDVLGSDYQSLVTPSVWSLSEHTYYSRVFPHLPQCLE